MGFDRSLAICMAAVLASGCSLAIQRPDPDRPRHTVPACDVGKGAVALDAVVATVLGLAAFAAFDDDAEGAGFGLLASGGLFVAAAVRGNSAANACRGAFTEYGGRMRRDPEAVPAGPFARRTQVKPPQPEPAPPVVAEPAPAPAPPVVAEPAPEPARPPAAQEPAATEDDWSDFWKEAP